MTPERPPGNGRAAASKPRWGKSRPGRLTNSLVGLSTAAIVSVYAVGYIHTQSTGDALAASAPDAAATSAPVPTTPPRFARDDQRGSAAPTTAPQQAAPATTGYRDGTYTGAGNSRHGGIAVSVVIQGGKITSAAITDCQTRYPCSQISALPGQVLARQSANINRVSGATDSSSAYRLAVAAALAKATA